MKSNRWVIAVAITGFLTPARPAPAQGHDDITTLKQQIEALDQKLRVLERKQEVDKEVATEKARDATRVTLDANGLNVSTANSNFVFKLRGGFQIDGRFFPGDSNAKDSFLLRRLRPIFEGTVFEKFDYRMMLDFASGTSSSTFNNANIFDAYVNYRLVPEFQIQAGKFKEPVGLERLQSWNNLLFMERGFPTQLVPNRDTGLMLQGELFGSTLNYAVGVFNGTQDGGSSDFDPDSDKDIAGRVFANPFKHSSTAALRGLGLGVGGTYGTHEGTLRGYSSQGQQGFFSYRAGSTNASSPSVSGDGLVWRVAPQAYWYWGPFGIFGEYVVSSQRLQQDIGTATSHQSFQNTAWQVAASWFLTGEENSYGRVAPLANLNPAQGGWGSWELTARVGELSIDDDAFPGFADPRKSAAGAFSYGVGLNWKPNRNIKLTLNYERTEFDGAPGAEAPFPDEDFVGTRVQFAF
jgi:phosphate-selective porin OprO/OprP